MEIPRNPSPTTPAPTTPASHDANTLSSTDIAEAGPTEDDIVTGSPDAKVVVVEYASVACPHCAAFHLQTWPTLKAKYVDTGKVKWIIRSFMLNSPFAVAEQMLLRCEAPTRRRAVAEKLFAKQEELAKAPVPSVALREVMGEEGVDKIAFDDCLADQPIYDELIGIRKTAVERYKVKATPTFFIGTSIIRGNQPLSEFEARLDETLGK